MILVAAARPRIHSRLTIRAMPAESSSTEDPPRSANDVSSSQGAPYRDVSALENAERARDACGSGGAG